MPRGGKIGNKGNPKGQPRKWVSTDFAGASLPRHLREDIYRIAQAIDCNPDLLEQIKKLLD